MGFWDLSSRQNHVRWVDIPVNFLFSPEIELGYACLLCMYWFAGHGADAKFVDWHLSKALIASCSKDTQVKLWSAKDGECVATMYGHKAGISQVWWNRNGNWLLTAGRDQVCKVCRFLNQHLKVQIESTVD